MKRQGFLRAMALWLAASLLCFSGLAEAPVPEETGEVSPESMEGEGGESMPDEIGGLSLLTLSGESESEPEPTPDATNTPEPAPAPTKQPIPWLTSVNYPQKKINFEDEIWAILTGKWGLSDFQAAGVMSSIQAESAFCPYNAEGRGGSDDRGHYLFSTGDAVGFGLCQWTSSGRKEALRRYAKARGSSDLVWDFDIQMGFMATEIDLNAVKSARSLYDVAEWMVLKYERPNLRYANSWPGTRYEKGKQIYKNHTGRDYDEPPLDFSATCSGEDAATPEGVRMTGTAPLELTVNSNYYWRLEVAEPTVEGWLEARCEQVYHPGATEVCVCGYAQDGDKALTLTAAKEPGPGQTFSAILRFEIYRGDREFIEVPVQLKSAVPGVHPVALGAALVSAMLTLWAGK